MPSLTASGCYSPLFVSSCLPPLGFTKERRQERAHERMGDDELRRKQTIPEHSLGMSTEEECCDAWLILFCQDLFTVLLLHLP